MNLKEIPADKLIGKASEKLKPLEQLKPPEWASYAKTGAHRERVPQQEDWWWTRAASLMRKVGIEGSVGVSRLRKDYGGRKNKGHRPEKKYKASGAVIRTLFHQLEAAGLMTSKKGKGRLLTEKGSSFLIDIARELREKSK